MIDNQEINNQSSQSNNQEIHSMKSTIDSISDNSSNSHSNDIHKHSFTQSTCLPIGLSTLESIRRNKNTIYIDKTHHVAKLINSVSKYYFLSRPRRFGKSLLLDTIKQAFLGRVDLFEGLYISNNSSINNDNNPNIDNKSYKAYNFDQTYPVIHFDFGTSSSIISKEKLMNIINYTLNMVATEHLIELDELNQASNYGVNYEVDYGAKFSALIYKLYKKTNKQVVILVDEYDKPILDVIEDTKQAILIREMLKDLYSVIKTNDAYIRFAFLTGVTKFNKVSLFSGLNNLRDITINREFSDICGYNQAELVVYFKNYIEDNNINLDKLRYWYNGYSFAGLESQRVYNPFDILLFFANDCLYRPYWFETATPTFLIKLIEKNKYFFPKLECMIVGEEILSSFEIEYISIITLLFQSGYLTIKEITNRGEDIAYKLDYPNYEVKSSLNKHLASIGMNDNINNSEDKYSYKYNYSIKENKYTTINSLISSLTNNEFDNLKSIFSSHFASIPYNWYINNNIDQYEGFYASIVYAYLNSIGYRTIAEDVTNQGRIDLTILMEDKTLIIEFKLNTYGNAIDGIIQMKNKKYYEKYLIDTSIIDTNMIHAGAINTNTIDKSIYLICMVFDPKQRNITEVVWEKI